MRPRRKERGEGMVSHLIVLVLAVLVCVSGAAVLATAINAAFGRAGGKIDSIN